MRIYGLFEMREDGGEYYNQLLQTSLDPNKFEYKHEYTPDNSEECICYIDSPEFFTTNNFCNTYGLEISHTNPKYYERGTIQSNDWTIYDGWIITAFDGVDDNQIWKEWVNGECTGKTYYESV